MAPSIPRPIPVVAPLRKSRRLIFSDIILSPVLRLFDQTDRLLEIWQCPDRDKEENHSHHRACTESETEFWSQFDLFNLLLMSAMFSREFFCCLRYHPPAGPVIHKPVLNQHQVDQPDHRDHRKLLGMGEALLGAEEQV